MLLVCFVCCSLLYNTKNGRVYPKKGRFLLEYQDLHVYYTSFFWPTSRGLSATHEESHRFTVSPSVWWGHQILAETAKASERKLSEFPGVSLQLGIFCGAIFPHKIPSYITCPLPRHFWRSFSSSPGPWDMLGAWRVNQYDQFRHHLNWIETPSNHNSTVENFQVISGLLHGLSIPSKSRHLTCWKRLKDVWRSLIHPFQKERVTLKNPWMILHQSCLSPVFIAPKQPPQLAPRSEKHRAPDLIQWSPFRETKGHLQAASNSSP